MVKPINRNRRVKNVLDGIKEAQEFFGDQEPEWDWSEQRGSKHLIVKCIKSYDKGYNNNDTEGAFSPGGSMYDREFYVEVCTKELYFSI